MSTNYSKSVSVLDKTSRRRFMRQGSAAVLAGAALSLGKSALAADCDQATSSDQDAGENADVKACRKRENIISRNQPQQSSPLVVKSVKA